MSDFLFHSKKQKENKLSNLIKSIYTDSSPKVFEFHGKWGSLAISRNPYFGFDPLQTETHIYFVIGGPVLTFTDNKFLTGSDPQKGTKKIVEKFNQNTIIWHNDLSGPFVFGILDKKKGNLQIISDIISFISVFKFETNNELALSTHPDILAQATQENNKKDKTSIADFILNGIVTFPYTFYKSIRQIKPASIYDFNLLNDKIKSKNEFYWRPKNEKKNTNIKETANKLRNDLRNHIKLITEGMNKVASFISGGEDSRAVLGLMPDNIKKESFVFLDEMNREGQFAKKAAEIYGANFNFVKRDKLHYINILEEASKLIGSGSEYQHSHSYNLYKKAGLNNYNAVIGGFLSDTFLKGHNINKMKYSGKLPLLPEIEDSNFNSAMNFNNLISEYILNELNNRQKEHFDSIKKEFRDSYNEWYHQWPINMHKDTPYLHSNRRLFNIYELFTSNKVVKTSVSMPTSWKMNRKLFHKISKPLFEKSKNLRHANGWHPYYGWQVNSFFKFINIVKKKLNNKINDGSINQGPWGDWNKVQKSRLWENKINYYIHKNNLINELFNKDLKGIFNSQKLTISQKINLLETLYITKIY